MDKIIQFNKEAEFPILRIETSLVSSQVDSYGGLLEVAKKHAVASVDESNDNPSVNAAVRFLLENCHWQPFSEPPCFGVWKEHTAQTVLFDFLVDSRVIVV